MEEEKEKESSGSRALEPRRAHAGGLVIHLHGLERAAPHGLVEADRAVGPPAVRVGALAQQREQDGERAALLLLGDRDAFVVNKRAALRRQDTLLHRLPAEITVSPTGQALKKQHTTHLHRVLRVPEAPDLVQHRVAEAVAQLRRRAEPEQQLHLARSAFGVRRSVGDVGSVAPVGPVGSVGTAERRQRPRVARTAVSTLPCPTTGGRWRATRHPMSVRRPESSRGRDDCVGGVDERR